MTLSNGAKVPRSRLVDVRTVETRDVVVAVGTLFGFMVGHGVLETARDALFLSRLPPERLPWVYIAMAAVGLTFAWVAAHTKRPAGPRRLSIVLATASVITAALSVPTHAAGSTMPYVVYVWVGLVATVGTVELWQSLGDRFTVAQAKRLFGLIGTGGVLGVATGSSLAAYLGGRMQPDGLLVAGALCLAISSVVPLLMTRSHAPAEPPIEPAPPPLRVAREEPHARRLLLLALVSTVTLTLLDFIFKSAVSTHVAPDRLAVFFGKFYAAVNGVALLVQLVGSAWVLRTVGALRGLALLPGSVLAGAIVFAAAPLFAVMVGIKAVDGALRHSIQRTGQEILYLPLPDGARRSLKGVAEVLGQRGGQAVASVGVLVGTALGLGARQLALALAALAAVWLLAFVGARSHYVELFRRRLRMGAMDLKGALPQLDLGALEVLLVSLNSVEEREALAALRLLEEHDKTHLVPPLLVYHPSTAVAVRGLALLARDGRRDVLPLVERLLARSEDPERRAAALHVHHALAPELDTFGAHRDDPSPRVRAMALVGMAERAPGDATVAESVREIAEGHDRSAHAALARAIADEGSQRWIPTLLELGRSDDRGVLVEVARAGKRLLAVELVPTLVGMLARRDVREAARDALAAIGSDALPEMRRALCSDETPLAVKRHLPRTLARFGSDATAVLLQRLAAERDGMTRYKVLRALGAMRAADPSLPLDRGVLTATASVTVERIIELTIHRVSIAGAKPASPERDLLEALLAEKESHAVERLFRLLGLLAPRQDYQLVYRGLIRGDPKARAASREILMTTVDRDLRDVVLVLVDDIDEEEKIARLRGRQAIVAPRPALEQMTRDRSEAVRLAAASCLRVVRHGGEEDRRAIA
jgi:ATP/ADP translocase